MKQIETYATHHTRALVTIERRKKYSTVDLDTWRDGYFTLPARGRDEIRSIIQTYGVTRYFSNHKGFHIPKVPNDVAEDLAQRIAEVAEGYRSCCNHSEWLTLTGRRAPLVGWIDRKGRRLRN